MRPWLILLLCGLAWADGGRLQVVTDPPGAKITQVGTGVLGFSDEVRTVEWESGSATVAFQLDLEGYRPEKFELKTLSFPQPPEVLRFPQEGALRLTPDNPLLLLKPYLMPAAALLVGVGAIGFRRWRAIQSELARAQKMREFEEGAETSGSLLMQRLGPYLLVDVLGRGGMSTVYRGVPHDTLEQAQSVAVKVLSRELAQDERYIRRFRREVEVSKNLVHPNIVRLLDYGEEELGTFLVQEMLDGRDLREQMPEQGLAPAEALKILEPIFEALTYAHKAGVVHRDLKPENVMVGENGRLRVTDFGLAKAEDSVKLTKTGVCMGTPAYMAPEQIREQALNPATDQYALGVMAYELLSGRLPFQAEDTIQVIYKHLSEPPDSLLEVCPHLSPAVEEVVFRMLSKDPDDRFGSTAEAFEALREVLA